MSGRFPSPCSLPPPSLFCSSLSTLYSYSALGVTPHFPLFTLDRHTPYNIYQGKTHSSSLALRSPLFIPTPHCLPLTLYRHSATLLLDFSCLKKFAALFQTAASGFAPISPSKTFMMRFPVSAIVLSLYAALAASSPISEPDTSDIDLSKIYVEGIAHAGSGCPSASVALTHNSNWTVFALVFERFSVSIGPGIPSAQKSKNCIVEVRLRYPPGYQYTIYQADFRDQATLDKGVNATHKASFWFAGETPKATLKA